MKLGGQGITHLLLLVVLDDLAMCCCSNGPWPAVSNPGILTKIHWCYWQHKYTCCSCAVWQSGPSVTAVHAGTTADCDTWGRSQNIKSS